MFACIVIQVGYLATHKDGITKSADFVGGSSSNGNPGITGSCECIVFSQFMLVFIHFMRVFISIALVGSDICGFCNNSTIIQFNSRLSKLAGGGRQTVLQTVLAVLTGLLLLLLTNEHSKNRSDRLPMEGGGGGVEGVCVLVGGMCVGGGGGMSVGGGVKKSILS